MNSNIGFSCLDISLRVSILRNKTVRKWNNLFELLPLGRTIKFIAPPWYKGGGGWWNPSPEFLICCSISKRFCLQWKAFDLLNKMRYISWVVTLLKTCDVTNNGRHLGRHLGFYQELEIRLKPREIVIFCAWHGKSHINKQFASF